MANASHTETERLAALTRFNILDTAAEPRYDSLTELACYIAETPIAVISLVDADRLWFKSARGVSVREIPREGSFCAECVLQRAPLIVTDARANRRFSESALVTGPLRICFYAGVPLITADGFALGTISVLDTVPRRLRNQKLVALSTLARHVIANFELGYVNSRLKETVQELRAAESGLRATEAALSEEKAALAEHARQLEKANEHLVMATITAHEAAEELEHAKIQLAHLAQHDALTGLPNRILLNDRLAQAISLAHRQGKRFTVMFLDIDRFKLINDSLGHTVGDGLLQAVAACLVRAARSSDTVCRQGGDEFVILLPDVERAEEAALSAQKIITELARPHRVDQFELQVTVSIGISIYPDDGRDTETLIKNADAAMYQAKELGRKNFQFFSRR